MYSEDTNKTEKTKRIRSKKYNHQGKIENVRNVAKLPSLLKNIQIGILFYTHFSNSKGRAYFKLREALEKAELHQSCYLKILDNLI